MTREWSCWWPVYFLVVDWTWSEVWIGFKAEIDPTTAMTIKGVYGVDLVILYEAFSLGLDVAWAVEVSDGDDDYDDAEAQPMALGMETKTLPHVICKYKGFMMGIYSEHSVWAYWMVTKILVRGVVREDWGVTTIFSGLLRYTSSRRGC